MQRVPIALQQAALGGAETRKRLLRGQPLGHRTPPQPQTRARRPRQRRFGHPLTQGLGQAVKVAHRVAAAAAPGQTAGQIGRSAPPALRGLPARPVHHICHVIPDTPPQCHTAQGRAHQSQNDMLYHTLLQAIPEAAKAPLARAGSLCHAAHTPRPKAAGISHNGDICPVCPDAIRIRCRPPKGFAFRCSAFCATTAAGWGLGSC